MIIENSQKGGRRVQSLLAKDQSVLSVAWVGQYYCGQIDETMKHFHWFISAHMFTPGIEVGSCSFEACSLGVRGGESYPQETF